MLAMWRCTSTFVQGLAAGGRRTRSARAHPNKFLLAALRALRPLLTPVQAMDKLTCLATSNALSGVPDGTPNRLLYAGKGLSDPFNVKAVSTCGVVACPTAPPISCRLTAEQLARRCVCRVRHGSQGMCPVGAEVRCLLR